MYVHARIEALSVFEAGKSIFSVIPFDVAAFKKEKKWGVFGFNAETNDIELVGIFGCLEKARAKAKEIIISAMKQYHLSQITNMIYKHYRWIATTPSNQWAIKFDYAEPRGFCYELQASGITKLVKSEDEQHSEIFLIQAIDNGKPVELIDTCYSQEEALQVSNIVNFIINPVTQ